MPLTKTAIKISHSPDSDDAFMFYALAMGKITHDFEFEFNSAEIEKLNGKAVNNTADDICALSFHTYAYVADRYQILRSGSSMAALNYGPRLVSKPAIAKQICTSAKWHFCPSALLSFARTILMYVSDTLRSLGLGRLASVTKCLFRSKPNISNLRIAIPGKLTSANLCLQIYAAEQGSKFTPVYCSFDEVFEILERDEVDAALLIHESQLKYQDQGYKLVLELGKWWHEISGGLSMPLGCNAISRKLDLETRSKLASLMKESIQWGLENHTETLDYARKFAANELDDRRAAEYISMYVNAQTLELSEDDLRSIELMFELANKHGLLNCEKPSLDLI